MRPLPGDLILYNVTGNSELISRLVAAAQLSLGIGGGSEVYSHVAVLSDRPGWQFEAKFPLTGHFPIDTSRSYEIWRIGKPTPDQRKGILNWCREHEGHLYNLSGLLTDGLIALRGTYVCSQFGATSYAANGIRIKAEGHRVLAPDVIPDAKGAKRVLRYDPPRKGKR